MLSHFNSVRVIVGANIMLGYHMIKSVYSEICCLNFIRVTVIKDFLVRNYICCETSHVPLRAKLLLQLVLHFLSFMF